MRIAAKSKTYARKTEVQKDTAGKAMPAAAEGTPLEQAMQSLYSLVGMMRNSSPEAGGSALNPKLVLTGTGLELRFSSTDSPEAAETPNRLAEIERSLKLLSARVGKMEEQLGSQSRVVQSLRIAVQQNEEMMDTLMDSMGMMDDLSFGQPELVLGPGTLAS